MTEAGLAQTTARCVPKTLAGAKPADLPIKQVSKFGLIVNMKTANAIGLSIPASIQLQATHFIMQLRVSPAVHCPAQFGRNVCFSVVHPGVIEVRFGSIGPVHCRREHSLDEHRRRLVTPHPTDHQ